MQEQQVNEISQDIPQSNENNQKTTQSVSNNPRNPKAASIIEKAKNSESLEHHSSVNTNLSESDPSSVQEEISEDPSDGHALEGSSIETESPPNDAQDVQDEDMPAWAKDNPTGYRKYKQRMKEKIKEAEERESLELKNKVAQYENYISNINAQQEKPNENIIYDPQTGMPIDISKPEGAALLGSLQLEEERKKFHQYQIANEYENLRNKQKLALRDKIEEAKFKYKDYDDVVINKGDKFTDQIIDIAAIITENDAKNSESGADFLYYLAKNEQELDKIRRANPYEQFKMTIKHVIDFYKKVPKQSKAPEPISPLTRGGASNPATNSNDYAKSIIKQRYSRKIGK